jgi:hypothetical protein
MPTTQNAVITITDGPLTVAVGVSVASVTVTCTGATTGAQPNVSVTPDATTAEFDNLAPDDYTFTAQAVDNNGNLLGTAATTTLTVTAISATVQVPVSISAVQP